MEDNTKDMLLYEAIETAIEAHKKLLFYERIIKLETVAIIIFLIILMMK